MKHKKSNQPPSSIHSSWKKTQKSGQGTHPEKKTSDLESAVHYGGMVGDSEDDDVESSAITKKSDSLKGNRQGMVRCEPTKKELCNGANKWKLSHLPADTDCDAFTKYITPLDPW